MSIFKSSSKITNRVCDVKLVFEGVKDMKEARHRT